VYEPWGWGLPLTRAKPSFFGQKLNFSGKSQQTEMKNIYIFVFIKRKKKQNLFRLGDKVPKIRDFY